MSDCAVYIPVGPSPLDLIRVVDLIDSLVVYEPCVKLIALVDHGPKARDFSQIIASHRIPITVLRHHAQIDNGTWLGAGCVTNFVALAFITSQLTVDFVLKLDTDALIIDSFADQISQAFRNNEDWGMAGSVGETCNKALRTRRFDDEALRSVERALVMAGRIQSNPASLQNADIVTWNLFTEAQRQAFQSVCDDFGKALQHGYRGAHCQGGAYAISWALTQRLRTEGFLDEPLRWLYIPMGEDRVMGVCCAALQMTLGDLSCTGEPFGVQNKGLPYIPEELIQRGNSIVHSLRNNPFANEETLRSFFRQRRENSR
jgi:hypothetical protein